MWRRTLQPQSLNLVRVLPIDNAAWISARVSSIPKLAPSSRYWVELRDDVLILYPAIHLLTQHNTLVSSPPSNYPFSLSPIAYPHALEKLPVDHIFTLAELVPSCHVVPFVLPSIRITCREKSQTICIRSTSLNLIRPTANILFNSVSTVKQWFADLNRAIHRDRKRLSDFRVIRHVGKGASGRVYEIEDKQSKEKLALKVIEKTTVFESKDNYKHAMYERLVLQIIQTHPYILDMQYAFQNAKRLFIVTEFCPVGDLFEYMNRRVTPLDERTTKFLSSQILLALSHLHSLGIVYRDLKLENILIDNNGHIRLADFGLTKVLRQHDGTLTRTNTFCGTREYVAPEMLRGDPYDMTIDFWTFGILLYEMMSGRTPFYTSDHTDIYRRIEKSPIFYPRHLSADVRNLLSKLLVRDPSKRLGSENRGGINAIKKHPWFKSVDWDAMMNRDALESPLKKSTAFQQRRLDNQIRSSSSSSSSTKTPATNIKNKNNKNGKYSSTYNVNNLNNIHNINNSSVGSSSKPNIQTTITNNRKKSRKEIKQEKAFANVLADVDADLKYASHSRIDKNSNNLNGNSFSSSFLALGRTRPPTGRSTGNLILAGYSFYNFYREDQNNSSSMHHHARTHTYGHTKNFSSRNQTDLLDPDAAAEFAVRSASAVLNTPCRWLVGGEQDNSDLDFENDEDEDDTADIKDEQTKARTYGGELFMDCRRSLSYDYGNDSKDNNNNNNNNNSSTDSKDQRRRQQQQINNNSAAISSSKITTGVDGPISQTESLVNPTISDNGDNLQNRGNQQQQKQQQQKQQRISTDSFGKNKKKSFLRKDDDIHTNENANVNTSSELHTSQNTENPNSVVLTKNNLTHSQQQENTSFSDDFGGLMFERNAFEEYVPIVVHDDDDDDDDDDEFQDVEEMGDENEQNSKVIALLKLKRKEGVAANKGPPKQEPSMKRTKSNSPTCVQTPVHSSDTVQKAFG